MLEQVKYFIAVAENRSFTEAAEKCFISQSAISQQIRALEEELGVVLINRTRRNITLTAAGEYFYQHGRDIVRQTEELCRETVRIGTDSEICLRIGYLEIYESQGLQRTVYEFSQLYPEVVISLRKYSHEDLFRKISEDEIDLVLSYQRRAFMDQYKNCHLWNLPCAAEVSSRSPLAGQTSVSTGQLKEYPCILVAKEEQRDLEQNYFRNVLGIGSRFLYRETMEEARLAVIAGQGFLPTADWGGEDPAENIVKVPLVSEDGKPLLLNFCAFWKRQKGSYYIEEFVRFLWNNFSELSHDSEDLF